MTLLEEGPSISFLLIRGHKGAGVWSKRGEGEISKSGEADGHSFWAVGGN